MEAQSIKYNGKVINYEIVKRKKKNVSITVQAEGKVIVSLPFSVSAKKIEEIVSSKAEWILNKIEVMKKKSDSIKEKKYISGEKFLYFGDEFDLDIIKDDTIKKDAVRINEDKIEIRIKSDFADNQEKVKKELNKWYMVEAKKYINFRVEMCVERLGIRPELVRIKLLKRTWGICTSKGIISLNWRLIMTPVEVMDYVIIHELCHLKHHNHSKDFWSLVGVYMPDYKKKRDWLKHNGGRVNLT
ncbi:MAG TPA: hypothetical protein DEP72_06990 [Clostridiales bacterium]|nr:MAG: hypothetical protein A2Y18_07905 [Clostridiales bacterium GWD2_32_19]HCC07886.1 hypothetical protein [Clostridiales bacterium]